MGMVLYSFDAKGQLQSTCTVQKASVYYSHWPRTCKVMGSHLNPGSLQNTLGT